MNHKLILKNNFFKEFPDKIHLLPSHHFKDMCIENGKLLRSYNTTRLSSPLIFKHNGEYYSLLVATLPEIAMYLQIEDMEGYVISKNKKYQLEYNGKSFEMYDASAPFPIDSTVFFNDIHRVSTQEHLWDAPHLEYCQAISFFKLTTYVDYENDNITYFIPDILNPDIHVYLLKDISYNPLSMIQTINQEPVDIPNHFKKKNILPNLISENGNMSQFFLPEVQIEVHWFSLYIGDITLSKFDYQKNLKKILPFTKTFRLLDTNIAKLINSNLLNISVNRLYVSQGYRIESPYLYGTHKYKLGNHVRLIQDIYCGIHDLDTIMNPTAKKDRDDLLKENDIILDIEDVESKLSDVLFEYIVNSKEIILNLESSLLKDFYDIQNPIRVSKQFLNSTVEEKIKLYREALEYDSLFNLVSDSYPYLLGYLLGRSCAITQSLFIAKDLNKSKTFESILNPIGLL